MADVAEHVEAVEQPELVTGDEVGLLHEVGRADRLGPEAQVRHRHRTGLLRVVDEVALGVQAGLVADDLHRCLVGPDGAVAAERVEHRRPAGLLDQERVVDVEAEPGDVVDDADGEPSLRCRRRQLVEHRLGHRRRELLRAESVSAADDLHALALGLGDDRHHVLEERLTGRPRFLAPVEHRDRADRIGQRVEQGVDRERPEQADRRQPDLLAAGDQLGDGLADGARSRPHHHDHPLGVGRSLVVDEPVPATGPLLEFGEHLRDDARDGVVEAVRRLARLEEHVGVLRRATHHRRGGSQPAELVCGDVVVGDQRPEIVVAEEIDPVDLVRGAEPVEEVQERDPGPQCRGMRHGGEVMGFLHRTGAQHGESGRPGGHHVAVVAEDRQRVRGDRTGGDVDHRRRELAGDLEHVRQHQQQALRGGEGRTEGARLQRAVQRSGRTGLGLQLDHLGHGAPQVGLAARRPCVGQFAHRRGRRDRVDRHDLRQRIGDLGGRLVAVDARRRGGSRSGFGGLRVVCWSIIGGRGAHVHHPCARTNR